MKKYTFYLGLKDKDTKMQIKGDGEYILKCQELTGLHLGGGTIQKGYGVFRHDDGTLVYENCIIIQTLGFHDNELYVGFANMLKTLYNQESILMEVSEVEASFI